MDDKKYRAEIVRKMKAVNTHNASFKYAVDVLAKTLKTYEDAIVLWEDAGGPILLKYTNKNGATNTVKHPLYQVVEKLRDDVISYSRELGLTPAGLKKINDELGKHSTKSKLEQVLGGVK